MLRTALLFLSLLGFLTSELHAAPSAATAQVHRRKPMAGDYRPVYKTYRGHNRHQRGFFAFLRRGAVRHGTTHSWKRGTL